MNERNASPIDLAGLNVTRNFEGCRALWTGVDAEDPNVWWATELWDTPDAHKAYMAYRGENGLEEVSVR